MGKAEQACVCLLQSLLPKASWLTRGWLPPLHANCMLRTWHALVVMILTNNDSVAWRLSHLSV